MKPLVSILVPAYNAEPYLGRTLECLLQQTWPNTEIIVVNDGSKDRTLEVARSFESRGVRVYTQDNQGQAAAFNTAYARCQGQYITFFDADDLVDPQKTERQMEEFLRAGTDDFMCTCEWARFYEEPEEAVFKHQPLWKDMDPRDWLVQSWETNDMMHGATWLIPRAVVEKAGLWDARTSLINDHDFFCRVMLQCRVIKFVPGVRTFYRSAVPGNLSGQKSRKAWESASYVLHKTTDILLAVENSERTRHACATKLQRFVYELYPEHPDLQEAAEKRVRELGGSNVEPTGGRLFHLTRRVMGWKMAKRLMNRAYRMGYLKKKIEAQRAAAAARTGNKV
jgi:glycosyltransferase involved in cell wall biosynthesis